MRKDGLLGMMLIPLYAFGTVRKPIRQRKIDRFIEVELCRQCLSH
jgi:hypothetical protein